MYFPSAQYRQRFYDLVLEMTADEEGMVADLDAYMTDDRMKVKENPPHNRDYCLHEIIKRILFLFL